MEKVGILRLEWLGQVKRMEEGIVQKPWLDKEVGGKRNYGSGNPCKKWIYMSTSYSY